MLDVHTFLLDIVKLYQSSQLTKVRKINPSKYICKRNLPRWISCISLVKNRYGQAVYSIVYSLMRERGLYSLCGQLISLGFIFLISKIWLLGSRFLNFLQVPICDSLKSHFPRVSVSSGSWILWFLIHQQKWEGQEGKKLPISRNLRFSVNGLTVGFTRVCGRRMRSQTGKTWMEEVFCYIKVLSVKKERLTPSTVLLPYPWPQSWIKAHFCGPANFKNFFISNNENHSSIVKKI